MNKTLLKPQQSHYFFKQLNSGNQQGLTYFYNSLYPKFFIWAFKRVKDDVAASIIANEAFLKLWLIREKISDGAKLNEFLLKQVKQGCDLFHQKSSLKFYRSFIRLDEIENYQDFIGGYWPDEQQDQLNAELLQKLGQEKKRQWKELMAILPGLPLNQQLVINLCLEYSFSYERIALHMGGLSDREVARKVAQSIENVKDRITKTRKLNLLSF